MAKILLVEDDDILGDQITNWLENEHHNVEFCSDGLEGAEKLEYHKYDVVVIDWGLPNLSGIEIIRKFRAAGGLTPVLILTGKGQVHEKEEGLEAGADDYVTKPFEIRELSARIKALLRRPQNFVGTRMEAPGLIIDTNEHRAYCGSCEVSLQPKEFDLLEFLVRHKGRVVKTQALLEHVWSSDSFVTSETIYTYVRALRKKIDEAGGNSNIIQTVRGVGYSVRNSIE